MLSCTWMKIDQCFGFEACLMMPSPKSQLFMRLHPLLVILQAVHFSLEEHALLFRCLLTEITVHGQQASVPWHAEDHLSGDRWDWGCKTDKRRSCPRLERCTRWVASCARVVSVGETNSSWANITEEFISKRGVIGGLFLWTDLECFLFGKQNPHP